MTYFIKLSRIDSLRSLDTAGLPIERIQPWKVGQQVATYHFTANGESITFLNTFFRAIASLRMLSPVCCCVDMFVGKRSCWHFPKSAGQEVDTQIHAHPSICRLDSHANNNKLYDPLVI